MLSVVIIGFIWQLILSPLWGVSEGFLRTIGLPQLFAPWLGQESSALITVSLISVWQFVGIPMMLIYAALLNIPEDLSDAATVDGANQWHVFWYVKLPLILPTLGIVAILTFVGNFNAFDLIYTIKGAIAGPNFATDILGTFFYRKDLFDAAGKTPPKAFTEYRDLAKSMNSPMRSGSVSCLKPVDAAINEAHWYFNAIGDGWFDQYRTLRVLPMHDALPACSSCPV
jgi:hypothetical protein